MGSGHQRGWGWGSLPVSWNKLLAVGRGSEHGAQPCGISEATGALQTLVWVCASGIYSCHHMGTRDASWAIRGSGTRLRVFTHPLSHRLGGGEPPAETAPSDGGAQGHEAGRRPVPLFDLGEGDPKSKPPHPGHPQHSPWGISPVASRGTSCHPAFSTITALKPRSTQHILVKHLLCVRPQAGQ